MSGDMSYCGPPHNHCPAWTAQESLSAAAPRGGHTRRTINDARHQLNDTLCKLRSTTLEQGTGLHCRTGKGNLSDSVDAGLNGQRSRLARTDPTQSVEGNVNRHYESCFENVRVERRLPYVRTGCTDFELEPAG